MNTDCGRFHLRVITFSFGGLVLGVPDLRDVVKGETEFLEERVDVVVERRRPVFLDDARIPELRRDFNGEAFIAGGDLVARFGTRHS